MTKNWYGNFFAKDREKENVYFYAVVEQVKH